MIARHKNNLLFKRLNIIKFYIILLIKIIIKAKFTLYKPKQTDILIADKKSGKEAVDLFFYQYKYDYLYTRFEEINIFVLIITLIKYKFNVYNLKELNKNYKKCMIEIINPKIVFCMQENNWNMYKTINKTYKYKLIIAQMPVIFGDACNYYYRYKDKFFACDYLLTHSKHSKKFLSKVIQTEFLNVGSFKLNSYLSDLPKQGDTGICFISQFRGNKGITSLANPILAKPLRHAYNLVSKVCQDHNILLSIALVSTRKDKSLNIDDEIKFYNKIYNKFHYANESSYNFAIKSNTIVCMNSTLGLELVSLGYKVLFLDTLISMIKMNTSTKESLPESRYNSPEKPVRFSNYFSHYYGDDGEFWDKGIDYDSVNEKIINLYEMDSDEWKNIYTKYTLPVQYHDPNNKILRSIIENKLGIV